MNPTTLILGLMAVALTALGVTVWLHLREQRARLDALRTEEERYRQLFENALEGVYECSPEGSFLRANVAMARILGYTDPLELLRLTPAQTARIYTAPHRRQEFFSILGRNDFVADFESEIRRPNGTLAWVKENVRVVRQPDGTVVRLQGFVSDITERRRAAMALATSDERYRVLFENLPVAIVEFDYRPAVDWFERLRGSGVLDLAGWIGAQPEEYQELSNRITPVGVNAAAARLLGTASGDGENRVDGRVAPDLDEARRQALLALWDERMEVSGELAVRLPSERVLRVYYHWRVPRLDGRPLLERTQLVLIDVSEVKSAEMALAAERERLSVTLRAMSEAVVTIDQDGVVQFMNDAASALTGWPLGAAIGRPLREVCVLGSERPDQPLAAPVAAALTADRAVDLPAYSVVHPRDGSPKNVEGRCAPMHDLHGRAMGAVLVLRDVTQRSRLEFELLRASKMESIGVLAGGIAHDFNNLLAIIMGNLSLAMMDEKISGPVRKWLREAERGTMRAKDLTHQLLTFAKGGEPVRTAVALQDVVREAAQFALHGTAVRCEFEIAPELRPADVDKGQIGQVVQNLVINAVQAMPAGGMIRIRLSNEALERGAVATLPAGNYLRLEVADTGRGIAPEHLARIFEPFFTTKEAGSGLGLATVYSVIQKHRGHITVESKVGAGTTFRIWLPAARIEPADAVKTVSPFAPLHGRVLFMDDEEPIRAMTQALLERLGLHVKVTRDGAEAVREYANARVSSEPYDVVIFDLTVPGGMGGADAMREILKIDPAAKGIVSSGYSSDPVMANYRAHGFRGSVPKPYRISDFSRTIREVMSDT